MFNSFIGTKVYQEDQRFGMIGNNPENLELMRKQRTWQNP
jgi:hypothetical protein